jgi:hypothetical protein
MSIRYTPITIGGAARVGQLGVLRRLDLLGERRGWWKATSRRKESTCKPEQG